MQGDTGDYLAHCSWSHMQKVALCYIARAVGPGVHISLVNVVWKWLMA